MKLSEKGLKSFDKQMTEVALSNDYEKWDRFSAIRQVKFEPDDFQGAVVLTISQAKELALKLKNIAEFFFLQTGEFDYDTDDLWECLTEKIKQAESK